MAIEPFFEFYFDSFWSFGANDRICDGIFISLEKFPRSRLSLFSEKYLKLKSKGTFWFSPRTEIVRRRW